MPGAPRVVGILAGGGSLPREIAEHVRANGAAVHIVGIEGECDRDIPGFPVTRVGWAQFGRMLRTLRNAGVTELVIVGSVRRPDLGAIKPDMGFLLNLPAVIRIVTSGGDDSVLTRVVRFFEDKGFKVVSPASLMPSLLVGEGPLGATTPTAADLIDVARGFDVVRALGPFDVGQAVIVSGGRVEAIEGAENTDAMLGRLVLRRRATDEGHHRRGVLVKRPKPGQEMRVDMPAIGPATVERAVDAELRGIAVLAGGAIALDRSELIRSADAQSLFVVGTEDRGAVIPTVPFVDPQSFVSVGTGRASERQRADAVRGASLLAALKPFHTSGGTVIDRGHVLAVECGEGIASLIARAGNLRQWGRKRWSRRTAVAVVSEIVAGDIRSVIEAAAAAHLAGVAVIGRTPDELAHGIEAAERRKLFLIAAPRQAGLG